MPNFLDGLRGFALLWLRMAVAIVIAMDTAQSFLENRELTGVLLGAGAIFIGVGLLTVASAPLVAVAEIPWQIPYRTGDVSSRFLIASILIALTFLGPGAYSIDRWLFGRKRLTIGRPAR